MTNSLERTLPYEVGISPSVLLKLLDELADAQLGIHSFMILRHGKVALEGWWDPYKPQKPHVLFSMSKTYTGLAIGFAIQDGFLSLDDHVVSFFPDMLPAKTCENMERMTVRNLLTMSTGFAADPHDFNRPREDDVLGTSPHCFHNGVVRNDINWVRNFFEHYVAYEPGNEFVYCTHGSYMLSVIVQRAVGETTFKYLQRKLFDPLGIIDASWELCPQGYNVGGWGLMLKTEDIAKVGQFLLQKGKWEDKQLLAPRWVTEATSCQIDICNNIGKKTDAIGYGYQIWIEGHESAFSARGAFGQYCIVLPQHDSVVAWFSGANVPERERACAAIWNILVPALKDNAVDDAESQRRLDLRLASLQIPTPCGIPSSQSEVAGRHSGISYQFAHNGLGFTSIRFDFGKGNDCMTLGYKGTEFTVEIGYQKWVSGKTCVKTADTDTDTSILFESIACSGAWEDDVYCVKLCFDETSYINTMRIQFDEKGIIIDHTRNCSLMQSTTTRLMGRDELASSGFVKLNRPGFTGVPLM